ncbi:MAG: hypothetical protein ACLRWM_12095 [Streptococcus sp.]
MAMVSWLKVLVINGNHYYFSNDYSQVKGAWANGRYYDGDSGQAVTNRFCQVGANQWAFSTKMVKR